MGSIAPPQNGSTINPPAAASSLAAWDSWSHLPLFVELPAGKKAPPLSKGTTGRYPSKPARLIAELPADGNVGLICGSPLGWRESWVLVVFDLDVPGERPRLHQLLGTHGFQTAAIVKTGGKHDGYQYYLPIPVADWIELTGTKKDWVFDDTAPGGARPTRLVVDKGPHFELKMTGYVVAPGSTPDGCSPDTNGHGRVLRDYLFRSPPMSPARCEHLATVNGPALRAFVDAAMTATESETDTNSGTRVLDSLDMVIN